WEAASPEAAAPRGRARSRARAPPAGRSRPLLQMGRHGGADVVGDRYRDAPVEIGRHDNERGGQDFLRILRRGDTNGDRLGDDALDRARIDEPVSRPCRCGKVASGMNLAEPDAADSDDMMIVDAER